MKPIELLPGFLDDLLLNEFRETYSSMNAKQKTLIRFALIYGHLRGGENDNQISQ